MSKPDEANDALKNGVTAAQLFACIWNDLVNIFGTAATAALLRRAAQRAQVRAPELRKFQIARHGWEYSYSLPSDWHESSAADLPAFSVLVCMELASLLREFTGEVVLRRLDRLPELQAIGFPVLKEE